MRHLKFAFSERKALEALAFVAREHPGLTPLYVAKVFFYAEKWHLNRYGRPIVADTYIAMPKGPVPSTIKNFLDEKWNWVDRPDEIHEAITVDRSGWLPRLNSGDPDFALTHLSESDKECLRAAIAFCADKSSQTLSDMTHFEKSWLSAGLNAPMNYLDFIDDYNEFRDEIIAMAYENAACGVI